MTSTTPLINLGDGFTQDRTPQCPPGLKLGHDDRGIYLTLPKHPKAEVFDRYAILPFRTRKLPGNPTGRLT